MASELQNIVDELASRLDAPTVLEDHEERMVVYSSHSQPIDEVRRESILRRATRREVMSWFRDQGIEAATEPLRIPGQPDQGILGRLCVPVRYQGRLMGWLFLIDDRARLSEADVAAARQAAEHAALLLYEEELGTRLTSGTLSHLLSPAADLREAAAGQIVDQGLLPARAPVVVAVVQPLGVGEQLPREAVSEALQDAARAGREATRGDSALRSGYADHGVVLVRAGSVADDSAGLSEAQVVADALRHRLRKVPGARVVAATGDPQPRLRDAYRSYQHARLAAKVAAVVPSVGDAVRWQGLGVFRALAQLPADAAESALDPRLAVLFADGDEVLIRTLETYLDLGCDVKAVSARLHLHRATLYYRLDKAEKLCGFNLRDGNDRLAVHLGFKLARLADLHPFRPDAGG
ncbi:MAG TPA: helix-turn-helix domain-containing protein [Streptosporangiaceae bacterium]